MTPARPIRRACFLAAATLLAVTIGAKPLYAVDADGTNVKKIDQKKTTAKKSKTKKSQDTMAPSGVTQYPTPNEPQHGSGY